MRQFFFILAGIISASLASAQADTIVVYDINTQSTGTILPAPFNTAVTNDHSSSFVGTMGNKFTLPQFPPVTNLFNGSSFSNLAPAKNFFNVRDYPARTAVRLSCHYNDTLHGAATGMLVGPCFVLAAAISIYDFTPGQKTFLGFDSIRVSPGFDQGSPQSGFPTTRVKKIYAFKSFLDGDLWDNFALLELEQPIGIQTGWTGIGFDSSPNFPNGKVYHKFSYPSEPNPCIPSEIYNGDTLYYNYGYISDNGSSLIIPGAACGIPGQSGSTFLYTNNTDYYSVGTLLFSNGYMHSKLTNSAFYRLLDVLNTNDCNRLSVDIKESSGGNNSLKLFPNPFHDDAILQFDYDPSQHYALKIVNVLGETILENLEVRSGTIKISARNLPAGLYFLQLQTRRCTSSLQRMIVE